MPYGHARRWPSATSIGPLSLLFTEHRVGVHEHELRHQLRRCEVDNTPRHPATRGKNRDAREESALKLRGQPQGSAGTRDSEKGPNKTERQRAAPTDYRMRTAQPES